MNYIVFNTGRWYDKWGQIIAATTVEGGVLFVDSSRNISGIIQNGILEQNAIMGRYDGGDYLWMGIEYKSIEAQLREVCINYREGKLITDPDVLKLVLASRRVCEEYNGSSAESIIMLKTALDAFKE